jgi:hypothetical protein
MPRKGTQGNRFNDVPKQTGHKVKDIDLEQLKNLMRMRPTLEDTAAFFGVSDRTITRLITKHFSLGFVAFQRQYLMPTRYDLVRRALVEALKTPVNTQMLIFCLKNLNGWSEKTTTDVVAAIQNEQPNVSFSILGKNGK